MEDEKRSGLAAHRAGETDPFKELYRSQIEKEREAIAARHASQEAWAAKPSEGEFNDFWVTPLEALDVHDIRMADDAEKWSIIQQLQAGTIRAVARKAQPDPNLVYTEHFAAIWPGAWRRMDWNDEIKFWQTGHLVVSAHNATDLSAKERYFEIRFDPESFSGKPIQPPREENRRPLVPTSGTVDDNSSKQELPEAALREWMAIFTKIYPDASEAFASQCLAGSFPAHHVTRSRLRRILPERARGRPKKNKDL